MKRGTKIALIILGVVAIGVGAYMLISSKKNKSGNSEKDDRKVVITRT
jgi:flagellar basal body-associated protein FliL